MREIRQSGSEGGAAELIGLPYPYHCVAQSAAPSRLATRRNAPRHLLAGESVGISFAASGFWSFPVSRFFRPATTWPGLAAKCLRLRPWGR
jgi:hypothetical protein